MLSSPLPSFQIETDLGAPQRIVAGIDEVGRGALAGDVVACAIILNPQNIPPHINDSKKLSPKKRHHIFLALQQYALIGIGKASAAEIDQHGILNATFTAMLRAIAELPCTPQYCIIDGNQLPKNLPCPARAIIRGDSLSLSIAAASIAAKVTRDLNMQQLAQKYPLYGWEQNIGYGTQKHRDAIKKYGNTPLHRQSFHIKSNQ